MGDSAVPAPRPEDARLSVTKAGTVLPFLTLSDLYAERGVEDWVIQDYVVAADKTVIPTRP